MIDLGSKLRQAREERGISLVEAAAATRIRERYLQALETNDWAVLPTPVQARGFLRNYAIYLGLDEGQVMSSFGQATRSAGVTLPLSPTATLPVRTTGEDGAVFRPRDIDIERARTLPAWLSSDVLIGIALAVIVAAIGFGLIRFGLGDSDDTAVVGTTVPGFTPAVTQGPTQATAVGSPGVVAPGPVTPTFNATAGSVQLSLQATEHVWVRVTVDGAQVLEGILAPGTPQTWQGTQQIVLETPNAAGLDVAVNGQPQGQLGERGETVVLAWGPSGPLPATPASAP